MQVETGGEKMTSLPLGHVTVKQNWASFGK